MVKEPKVSFEMVRASDYKVIFSDGVFGTLNQSYGTMIFYSDTPLPEFTNPPKMQLEKMERVFIVEVKLPRTVFKSISEWMARHVKEIEDEEKGGK